MEEMEVIFMEYTDVLVEYVDRFFMEHEFTPVISPVKGIAPLKKMEKGTLRF